MTEISWPSDTVTVIDNIRDAIGRDITWYVVASSTACPICNLDPITNTSTNSFCPTCSGEYWIPVYSGVVTKAHITWGFSEQLGWVTGGQLPEGDCRVQIKNTITNLDAVDRSIWVEVDNRRLEVLKKILRGVQDINRILVDLKEIEE